MSSSCPLMACGFSLSSAHIISLRIFARERITTALATSTRSPHSSSAAACILERRENKACREPQGALPVFGRPIVSCSYAGLCRYGLRGKAMQRTKLSEPSSKPCSKVEEIKEKTNLHETRGLLSRYDSDSLVCARRGRVTCQLRAETKTPGASLLHGDPVESALPSSAKQGLTVARNIPSLLELVGWLLLVPVEASACE
ncbi:hypothetical protein B0H19DRAFT_1375730 [Mycena capillaripes]|nr:hypothetical protein B0H19DRAFT_1375730 [Mycena capillaripes]